MLEAAAFNNQPIDEAKAQQLIRPNWRRGRDSNPRSPARRTTVFETAPFDRSGTSPMDDGDDLARSEPPENKSMAPPANRLDAAPVQITW